MAAKKRKKPRKAGTGTSRAVTRVERREVRYAPSATSANVWSVALGCIAAAVLGAGVYGYWLADERVAYAMYLVAGGAVGLAAALFFGDSGAHPVRVGEAGVAVEKGNEMPRIAWCDATKIQLEGRNLRIVSEGLSLELPFGPHKLAIAHALKEAAERRPKLIDVPPSFTEVLPKPSLDEGQEVKVEGAQVAGRHCKASDRPISFERDARLCPNCGEVYYKSEVPTRCLSCDRKLEGRAIAI